MSHSSNEKQKPFVLIPILKIAQDFLEELYRGAKSNTIPWHICAAVGLVATFTLVYRVDAFIWRYFGLSSFYPFHPLVYWPYFSLWVGSGFWGWGVMRVIARHRLISILTSTFRNDGLQTKTGRLPSFIADHKMDMHLRKLVVSSVGLPKQEFEKAKQYLSSELQVHIDEIKAYVERGTVEILYAYNPLIEKIDFDIEEIKKPLLFKVGQTRSGPLYVSLKDVPHILVGGYTNSGKSTFLRQALLSLVATSPDTEFSLIDLKRGLEFQTFEALSKVRVYIDAKGAIEALKYVEGQLEKRMELLKANKANDLDAYERVPKEKRQHTKDWPKSKKLNRHIVVIDEAAELFLASSHLAAKDAQVARRMASQIAALGRAVGIHLIVATQRPDRNAVDPLIKTNLQGRLCFQMADNASSMTILDSVRAADLPPIRGRAIWRSGFDLTEVQVPFIEREKAQEIIEQKAKEKKTHETETSESVQAEGDQIVVDEISAYDAAKEVKYE